MTTMKPGDVRTSANDGREWGRGSASSSARPKPKHGYFSGQTWHKTVRYSSNLYRTHFAWTVDEADLAVAEQAGIVAVEYYEPDQQMVFRTTPERLRQQGTRTEWGGTSVIALPLQLWEATPCSREERGYKPPKGKGDGQHP